MVIAICSLSVPESSMILRGTKAGDKSWTGELDATGSWGIIKLPAFFLVPGEKRIDELRPRTSSHFTSFHDNHSFSLVYLKANPFLNSPL